MSRSIFITPALWRVADLWVAETGASHATLGNRAVLSSGIFDRLSDGKTITVQNFERLLSYLAEARNWPDAAIPNEAAAVLDAFKAIGEFGGASPDNSSENIGRAA